jgi:micrococcal nuclease
MNFNAKETRFIQTHQIIIKIVDGDGFFVRDFFTNEMQEVRLLGIDAPEYKKCSKLKRDESEIHLPGQLLMKLGRLSLQHMINIAPVGTNITLAQEQPNQTDPYGRTLAYAYLPDGSCINEIMVRDGYAKAFNRFYCDELEKYQLLERDARINKKGLYLFVDRL